MAIKDILRLKYQGGLSHERIARSSQSISKGVVAKYVGLAGAVGLDWQACDLDEASLGRRLIGRTGADTRVVEADFARVHIELRRKGVTLVLLWQVQKYRAANEGPEHLGPAPVLRALPGVRQVAQAFGASAPARR